MMDNGEESRRDIKAAWREFAAGTGDHVGSEELIRYQRGQLNSEEQAKVESHLSQCARCVEALVEAGEFLRSVSRADGSQAGDTLNQDFETLIERLRPEISLPVGTPRRSRPPFWLDPRALLPLAASLLVAVVLSVVWGLSLRQDNLQLAELRNLDQANRGLQEKARQLQDQMAAAQQHYESELAQLNQPEVNVPIANIYPGDARERSTNQSGVNRIRVPRGTNTFILILSDYERGYSDYGVDIVDPTGQSVWKAETLKPLDTAGLSLKLSRALIQQGMFTVRLFGRQKGREVKVADYSVLVEYL